MLALSQLYLSYAALWAIKAGLVLLNNFDRYSAALKLLGRQGRDGDKRETNITSPGSSTGPANGHIQHREPQRLIRASIYWSQFLDFWNLLSPEFQEWLRHQPVKRSDTRPLPMLPSWVSCSIVWAQRTITWGSPLTMCN